jgi:hypothetical protein
VASQGFSVSNGQLLRRDLPRPVVAFGPEGAGEPGTELAKVSTDISLVAIDRSDPEAFALAEVILRGVNATLGQYLKERPLLRDCCREPQARVLAWILDCNGLPDGGTEFHWQGHHEEAERGTLLLFPAGVSHIHRGRVSQEHSKTIATGWINAGTLAAYVQRLAARAPAERGAKTTTAIRFLRAIAF